MENRKLTGISYAPGQTITFLADHKKVSVVKIVDEMKQLCITNHLRSVELFYFGFKFDINKESDVEILLSNFVNWIDNPKPKPAIVETKKVSGVFI